jgi:2-polyprenyl-6-methoxyphenol hydroxylase-like FAD-dependent oxidoreductase
VNDVLVVGAGPVGLVTACDLLRQGIPVRVVDAGMADTAHSRAIVVWPRTLELLRRIGVAGRLAARGRRLDAVSFHSERRRIGTVRLSGLTDTPYPYAVTVPQTETELVLRERLTELGGRIERGVRLVQAADLPSGGARAVLAGPDGAAEHVVCRWLVGADGSQSSVRDALGVAFPAAGREVHFAIGDGPLDGGQAADELVYAYSRAGALGIAPLADGAFRIAFSVPGWPAGGPPPPRELFQQMVDDLAPRPGRLAQLRWSTVFRARRRTATTFRVGSCFLAGDAAHVFSAAGAQGMNTGIQDGVALAWRLGGVERGALDVGVLEGYDAERRRSVERVSTAVTKQTEWGLLRGRGRIAARDALVRAADRSGVLQRFGAPLISQTDTDYGPPRALGRPGSRLRAGMRLPVFPADLGHDSPGPLPQVDPDGFTVLARTDGARDGAWHERLAALVGAAGERGRVHDLAGHPGLGGLFGRGPTAVVVRPDGHVAAVVGGADPGDLTAALDRAGVVGARPVGAAR